MSQDITIITATPIDTLTELRRQNSALLQRDVAGEGTAKPSPGELLGFLTAAAKLGRSLEDYEQRETAQGIMDYWIAALLSAAPEASESTRPFTLEPFDECTAHEHLSAADQLRVEAVQAAQRAEDILTPAQEDTVKKLRVSGLYDWLPRCLKPYYLKLAGRDSEPAVMKRLMLCFVRLKENSTEPYSVPVADSDIIFKEPNARKVLQQLISAGVVRQQGENYLLTHDSLLVKWSFLIEVVAQRRSFRQLARGWDNGGRQKNALLNGGDQLREAREYPHKDRLEEAFLNESSRSGRNYRTYVTVFMGFVIFWLLYLIGSLDQQNKALEAARAALEAANLKLQAANLKIQQRAAKAEVVQSRLYSLRDQLLAAKDKDGKIVPVSMANAGVRYWDWASSPPAMPPSTASPSYASPPPALQTLQPRTAAFVLDLLAKVTPPAGDPERAQMEMFLSIESSDAAYARAKELQAKLAEPALPSKDGFDFPARCPLMRRVVPDKGKVTEVRYSFAGLGKEGAKNNPAKQEELQRADPDLKIAQKALERLQAAGFQGAVQIVPQDDHDAPEHFIQISFAKGSLD